VRRLHPKSSHLGWSACVQGICGWAPRVGSVVACIGTSRMAGPAILGVQILVALCVLLLFCLNLRLLYLRRKHFKATLSVKAVCGTCFCPTKGSRCGGAVLFGFRLSVAAWQVVVMGSFIVRKATSGGPRWAYMFIFYTCWNYLLQTLWWLAATAASFCSLYTVAGPSANLRRFVHLTLSISMPAAILVSTVLWGVLLPADILHGHGGRELNFYSYGMHAINTALLLLECSVNRMLVHHNALPVLLVWICLYVAFAFAQHAASDFWPYFFMELDTWAALGWYSAMLLLHLAAYGLVKLGSRCKARWRPEIEDELLVSHAVANLVPGVDGQTIPERSPSQGRGSPALLGSN